MQWYYSKNGTQLGPIGTEDLQSKLASGEVAAGDLVWKDGMADWLPAGQIPELRPVLQATSPAAPASVRPSASSPYSPPVAASAPVSSAAYGGQPIPNYLWQSIVVTILCCWPLGIPAIVFAAKVDGLKARGDIAGAMEASKKAKMWTGIAFGLGLAVILIYVIFAVVVGVSGASRQSTL